MKEYHVTVSEAGDVNINSPKLLGYATMCGSSGLQCNAKEDTDEYRAIKRACMDVANAMRALDDALRAVEGEEC